MEYYPKETATVGGGSEDDNTVVVGELGIDQAMATVIQDAEGLMPTYEEALLRH